MDPEKSRPNTNPRASGRCGIVCHGQAMEWINPVIGRWLAIQFYRDSYTGYVSQWNGLREILQKSPILNGKIYGDTWLPLHNNTSMSSEQGLRIKMSPLYAGWLRTDSAFTDRDHMLVSRVPELIITVYRGWCEGTEAASGLCTRPVSEHIGSLLAGGDTAEISLRWNLPP